MIKAEDVPWDCAGHSPEWSIALCIECWSFWDAVWVVSLCCPGEAVIAWVGSVEADEWHSWRALFAALNAPEALLRTSLTNSTSFWSCRHLVNVSAMACTSGRGSDLKKGLTRGAAISVRTANRTRPMSVCERRRINVRNPRTLSSSCVGRRACLYRVNSSVSQDEDFCPSRSEVFGKLSCELADLFDWEPELAS